MKRAQLLFLQLSLSLQCGVLLCGASATGEEVDIIVKKANTIGDLSLADAKKSSWVTRAIGRAEKRVTILMLAQGLPERAVILREIYKNARR